MPAVAFLLVFHLLATAGGGYYALTEWNGISDARWIGLRNFERLFRDPLQTSALLHTIELAVAFVVLVNVLGLVLALGLNKAVKTRNVLRALFFAPAVVSPLAVAYVWGFILENDGALNSVLGTLGLSSWQDAWLAEPSLALWTILVVLVWQQTGLVMVIYLAGLQSISDDVYEATFVDGARPWMRFRRVTLPLLAPATTIAVTLTLIYGLRVFDQVLALTNGGPADATETLATQVYKQTFAFGNYGYGAAVALVMTALILVVALLQLVVLRRREGAM